MTTRRRVVVTVAVIVSIVHGARTSPAAQDGSKTWSNVMYLGGAAGVRGKSLDWNNRLTISKDTISFSGKNGVRFDIPTSAVQELEYAGHRHANDEAASTGLLLGGLVGLLAGSAARSTDHYLMVGYSLPDGLKSAILFRLHKENQRDIIDAMRAATGLRN